MIGRAIDSLISVVSPSWGLQRTHARATLDQINSITNGKGGYSSGKYNRLTRNWARSPMPENLVPMAQIDQMRAASWTLYRDNPYARKIVRTLEAKVIGRGMSPQPLAKTADGAPFDKFRARLKELWWACQAGFDIRGLPGRGGLDMVELQKMALRSTILSGDSFTRFVTISQRQQASAGIPVRLQVQLISRERLSQTHKAGEYVPANLFYRGIEFDTDGRRQAYHFYDPQYEQFTVPVGNVRRVASGEIVHLYQAEDVDQFLGVPWFAPAILQARDVGDLQYNVLKSAAIASCFVAGYKLSRGQQRLGLAGTESDGSDLTDDDGNTITKVQPGMLINLGRDGELQAINPTQPTTNIEAFISHLLRGVGAAMPGVKGSTITGDYRNASFSSERSADNDCWPEMESVQDWFAANWCQPVWERIVSDAFISGWFSGIVTAEEFAARRRELLDTQWQGPKPRSINPTDDAKAALLRIGNGTSSVQMECAAANVDWRDVLRDNAEFFAQAVQLGIPEEWILGAVGVPSQVVASAMVPDTNQGDSNAQ